MKNRNYSADWTSPLTNRFLLDAIYLYHLEDLTRDAPPGTTSAAISVTEQSLNNLVYRAPTASGRQLRDTTYKVYWGKMSASYITGSHALKVGFVIGTATETTLNKIATQPFEYRFNNGVPNRITLYGNPFSDTFDIKSEGGIYVQDRWTTNRLTVNYGARIDWFSTGWPAQTLGPTPILPNRNVSFAAGDGISWKDFTPKFGAAYDVRGDGRTALKVSLNKYLRGLGSSGLHGRDHNPLRRTVLTTTRSWNDANGDFVPDCDLTAPAANGECGRLRNPNLGLPTPSATYDPDNLTGWGIREYNWEFSAGIQQQVAPAVSVDVSYFRRWYGNFFATDNRALSASDFDTFTLTAPTSDPRLPTAGSSIGPLYNVKPEKFGIAADNFITGADAFGEQIEHWNGVDFTVNARPDSGILLQSGISTGKRLRDRCEIVATLPEMALTDPFCRDEQPWLTQVKLLASYIIPTIDVQVSGTIQSIPGPQITAAWTASNAVIAPALGRNLSGGDRNERIQLLAHGEEFNDRMNQVDVRVGKILNFGGARSTVNLDVFNLFNGNTILAQNNSFGGRRPWLSPTNSLNARLVKIGVQFDF